MAKVAMVLTRSPGPPMTGRKSVIRSAIAALLSEGHEVDLIIVARPDPAFRHPGRLMWLGTPGKASVLFNAARVMLGASSSLNEALFQSRTLLAALRPLHKAYDFAIADTIRVAPYAAALGVPWHLDMDDLFSERYERFAAAAGDVSADTVLGYYRDSAPGLARAIPRSLMRHVLHAEAARIRERELYWAGRANTVSLVSPHEAERFSRQLGRPVLSLPMSVGLATAQWTPRQAIAEPVFVGPLDYKPNLDALDYYQREVFPALQQASAPWVLHHVGNAPERLRRLFKDQVVRFEGYVADLAARLAAAACFVAPIVSGTGIKTKVLEAMAAGVPVITTAEGVSGLQVKHERECLVCERPSDFAAAMRALSDRALAAHLSQNARSYVQENFSPEVLRRRWAGVMRQLAR
ncbi:MAG TPA: glycosyltransferase family 4 protein [Burkholderiales bacterium]|nr:glycosyltransferase family 4 protein [Burkholderiales bacterium]